MSSRRPFGPAGCYFLMVAMVITATVACVPETTRTGLELVRPGLQPVLIFENATTDPVAVHLADQHRQWLIGHVQAGHTATLRLPAGLGSLEGRELSVIALASGGHHQAALPVRASGGVAQSISGSGDNLFRVRWRLVGQQIIPMPLIGGGR